MTDAGDPRQFPAVTLTAVGDPLVPLMNLAAVRDRMDSLQRFLSDSVNRNLLLADHQMTAISTEIAAAIRHVIVNGAALLANSQNSESSGQILFDSNKVQIDENLADLDPVTQDRKSEAVDLDSDKEEIDHCEIVELDAVELLAEHIHFCEICGKGFKRDANLRMHMRAHGNQFKTPEALAKPQASAECIFKISKSGEQATIGRKTRFSCPYVGCNRNKQHKNFRPLKSVICVKNHFKRSHCPKMYACNRCHKKSFSVVADLKSHLRHCGESRWRCSCGTTFSRKDKLFGHMALFEGHMPAIADNEAAAASSVAMEEDTVAVQSGAAVAEEGSFNVGLDSGIYDGFGSIENEYMQEMLRSCSSSDTWKNWMMEEQYKYTFW